MVCQTSQELHGSHGSIPGFVDGVHVHPTDVNQVVQNLITEWHVQRMVIYLIALEGDNPAELAMHLLKPEEGKEVA